MSTVSSAVPVQTWAMSDGIPPEFAKFQAGVQESIRSFATPLNITLFIIFVTIVYRRANKSDNNNGGVPTLPGAKPITFRTFTPRTLLPFNGNPSTPHNPEARVYLAVKGKVYDVSSGRNFYGPGGPYENFAGRDATRGLACQSFEEDMLTKDLDGPLDDCSDLGAEEIENLNGWVERFDEKYLVVGKLIAFNSSKMPFT